MGWICPTPSQEETQEQAGKNNTTTKFKKKKHSFQICSKQNVHIAQTQKHQISWF